MQHLYDRLAAILTTRLRVPADLIHPDASYADLDLDSLALVELLAVMDEELGVHVGEEEISADSTLAQTADLLTAKGVRT